MGPIKTEAPENMPRLGNTFSRWLGRCLLRMFGWTLEGTLPNEKKIMVALAPHTSNWDFVVAMPAIMGLGVKISYLMKKEAFFWPMAGTWRWLGGIPTDRSAAGGVVEQVASYYAEHDKCWVAITPEGTRSKVDKWKTGFIRIAHRCEVPVVVIGFDGPGKRIVIDKSYYSQGNYEAEADELRDYVNEKFVGISPEHQ
ncbi:1-acyl-sn-glycerol-3-phosphate acyltransferase [uncultured Pseudoteredinibacter sp.]|uniref:1-acyl-sn-glycerol-3-phosphate acyltransferase n=1 Tax=uncultured Pseudoteredinibacter sp. TaxID=1641701 RepID=UPI00263509B1|nr:1-acyl-sn-glycerol-3-phosphate acyltransferase [uncultured Pseudoteredinibacter sp.]